MIIDRIDSMSKTDPPSSKRSEAALENDHDSLDIYTDTSPHLRSEQPLSSSGTMELPPDVDSPIDNQDQEPPPSYSETEHLFPGGIDVPDMAGPPSPPPHRPGADTEVTHIFSPLCAPGTGSAPHTPGRTTTEPSSSARRSATNMVCTTRLTGSISGMWLIDPAMEIHRSLLPPLQYGETEATRSNLYLKSNTGSIDAEVELVPRDKAFGVKKKRVWLRAKSLNGSVAFTLREAKSDIPSTTTRRLPVTLDVQSLNGSLTVAIPRSFRGTVSLTTLNGSIKASDALNAQIRHENSDHSGVSMSRRRVFIGDFPVGDEGLDKCDEVMADTKNGSVRVMFEDERPGSQRKGSGGGDKGGSGHFANGTRPTPGRSNTSPTAGVFSMVWSFFDV